MTDDDATRVGVGLNLGCRPRVGRLRAANPGLKDASPLGLNEQAASRLRSDEGGEGDTLDRLQRESRAAVGARLLASNGRCAMQFPVLGWN